MELTIALDQEWQQWADELEGWKAGDTFMDIGERMNGNNMMCRHVEFHCDDCILMESTCSDNPKAVIHPALRAYNNALEDPEDVPTIISSVEELLELLDLQREYPNGKVIGRDGEVGRATGATYRCRMAGCSGIRITTRWSDGAYTHPCSKGMTYNWGVYNIGRRRGINTHMRE